MKNIKTKIIKKIPLACFCLVMAVAIDWIIASTTLFILDPIKQYPIAEVSAKTQTQMFPETTPVRQYVLTAVYDAGLNPDEADCIIREESQWREDICIIEPNNSISCGLWQLNTVHNKNGLTNACKLDYKCATKFAIEKRLKDGNWNAWTQWSKCK